MPQTTSRFYLKVHSKKPPRVNAKSFYRDPHLFRVIETYLSGYQIFPLPDDGWPNYMSKEAARKNLMDDAKFYGLDKLVHLLEEDINRAKRDRERRYK
jgi:hypothetical protein